MFAPPKTVKMLRKTFLFAALICFVCNAKAQQTGYVDTVEVTSTQIPLRIQETGRNVSVISAEVIREMPAVSIDEILQFVPGVEVQSRGGFGVQANILMRGSTFTQVLILVDGMRLNDPLTGHFNGYIPVAKDEIERIEVLRGPAAAMYGPDAMGGLINIVTKTFAGTAPEGIGGTADLGFGSNSHLNGAASVSGRNDRLSWNVSGMINNADGERIPRQFNTEGTELDPFRTFFKMHTAGASLAYKIKDNLRVKFRTSYDFRDFNARYFYTNLASDKATEQVSQSFSVMHLEQVTAKRRSDLQVSYRYSTDDYTFSPDFPSTNSHTMQFTNVITNHLWEIDDKLMLKGGIQVDHRQIVSNDRGNHDDWHTGAYAMALYRPTENLHITGSMRADYDENYGLEYLPQLNLSYEYSDAVTIRGAAGRSIRAADYTERFVSNNLSNLTPGRSLGNPDLLAEVSWSQELGADIRLMPGLMLKATGFLRQGDRLIDYVRTPASVIGEVGDLDPEGDYLFARNITDVRANGAELEAVYTKRINERRRMTFTAGYTFVNTYNRDGVVSVYIANHARHLATASAMVTEGRWSFNVSSLYKARDARAAEGINAALDPDYMLWNGNVGFRISENFSLSGQVMNIFDADYQNILGAPMPGRWLIGSVQVRF